ncbi:MAG TPA: divalent-cation tolerance protein CutA [Bacillota bacterium]|nr:divalent-cation tolerance protein CutA [Clostridiales bacterium]HPT85742.1 divalent-cation tolerance protein CutA [Bacillota bacterium]
MGKYGIVMTTLQNEEQAQPVIEELIKSKLAACVQQIGIKSHYTWKGELCREDEILVLIKTKKELYPLIEKKLLELHPYEVPEIIMLDIEQGSATYLAWIDGETQSE